MKPTQRILKSPESPLIQAPLKRMLKQEVDGLNLIGNPRRLSGPQRTQVKKLLGQASKKARGLVKGPAFLANAALAKALSEGLTKARVGALAGEYHLFPAVEIAGTTFVADSKLASGPEAVPTHTQLSKELAKAHSDADHPLHPMARTILGDLVKPGSKFITHEGNASREEPYPLSTTSSASNFQSRLRFIEGTGVPMAEYHYQVARGFLGRRPNLAKAELHLRTALGLFEGHPHANQSLARLLWSSGNSAKRAEHERFNDRLLNTPGDRLHKFQGIHRRS